MKSKAVGKYIRISSRKVKPVADLVRGKTVTEARAILKFTPRKASFHILKVLDSAVANAINNHHMNEDVLFVEEVYANQGPVFKRWKAGSKGGAKPILRRTSHIGVVVSEK